MANQNPSQTLTLRQRLMEPPRLSSLQASPLLPLGGAVPTTNQQHCAIYTATKPQTQTSSSNSKSAQNQPSIMSVGKSPQPKTQQALKQHLHQASPIQTPVLPQQTGPPNMANQQPVDPTSSETRMIDHV